MHSIIQEENNLKFLWWFSLNDRIMDNHYLLHNIFFKFSTMGIQFFYNREKIFIFLKSELSERGTHIKRNPNTSNYCHSSGRSVGLDYLLNCYKELVLSSYFSQVNVQETLPRIILDHLHITWLRRMKTIQKLTVN